MKRTPWSGPFSRIGTATPFAAASFTGSLRFWTSRLQPAGDRFAY
jgi:hypothetical protein